MIRTSAAAEIQRRKTLSFYAHVWPLLAAAGFRPESGRGRQTRGQFRMMMFRGELAAFAAFLAIAIAFQVKEGAYGAEFAENADEPAHYITGLMVRDYLAGGLGQAPRQFAQTYYEHYPKVALGHWPPLFYVVQAAWTLPFTPSRSSVLLLMAVLSALTAAVLVRFARAVIPLPEVLAAGCLMLSLPLMRKLGEEVMSETLVALTVLTAVLHLGDYLDRGELRQALRFGLCAVLAILTKGTALVLGLAPPLAILLGWRWRLVKNRSFWAPATIAILVCVPWYLWAPDALHESVAAYGGLRLRATTLVHTLKLWSQAIGPFASPFALIGIVRQFARFPVRKPGNGRWIAAGALLLSVGCFQCLVVVAYGIRIVSIVVPVLLMFTVSGVLWLASWRPLARLGPARVSAVVLAGVLAGTVVWASGNLPPKPRLGYRELVSMLSGRPEWQRPKVLIVSDSVGEGAFAEVAMSETRSGHTIVRGSKFLVSENWMGTDYRMLYATPEEVLSAMSRASLDLVVLDVFAETHVDTEPGEHVEPYRLLRQTIEKYPDRWQAIFAGPVHPSAGPDGRPFLVFARNP
jgi:hypothetical protein